jgi:uncharacterized membrane protein YeaQ/YmgE (transglycosylase-associated protein family)
VVHWAPGLAAGVRKNAGGTRRKKLRAKEAENGHLSVDSHRADSGGAGQVDNAGDDPDGIIVTALIGMVGAVVGGFVMYSILGFNQGGFIWSIIVATIGAIILLALYRLIVGQRSRA